MKRVGGFFERIVGFDNLLLAQRRAARGKRCRTSVARFEFHLEHELFELQDELMTGSYQPGEFFTFEVRDPKRRAICAAPFRDRVVHHALCHVLEPHFERRAIFDSYACRLGKGTHAAIARARQFARRHPYFLKCDVRKFFASVDHGVLFGLLERLFKERPLLDLLARIINHAPPDSAPGKGLPIGNLTSQHFANLYLGELDHFLKDQLHIKGYLRYMDDFLLFAEDKPSLHLWLADLEDLLEERLDLGLKQALELLVFLLGQLPLQPPHFPLPERVNLLPVQPRHMEAVCHHHDTVAEDFPRRLGVAFVQVAAHALHRVAQVPGYAQEKRLHRGLLAILQNPQQAVFPLLRAGRDNRRKIPVALFQGDLVDAQGRQAAERTPIHALPELVRDDVLHFVVTYLLLFADILNRAVDQAFQDMLRIRLRSRRGAVRTKAGSASWWGSPDSHRRHSGAA